MRLCARTCIRILDRRIAVEANVVSAIFYFVLDFNVTFWVVADKTDMICIFHLGLPLFPLCNNYITLLEFCQYFFENFLKKI